MKALQFILFTALFLWSGLTFGQGINYKALIKDNNGNVIANDLIEIQFTILQGSGMSNVCQETLAVSTDNGIVYDLF